MYEFNPDGSIRLPERLEKNIEANKEKLKRQRCIRIKRNVVSFTSPKRCVLRITLSEALHDNRFIENIYKHFSENSSVPTKISRINEKEFEVEIGTDFRRCTDCISLIGRYREFLEGNIIDEKGSCTFDSIKRDFCYEDYFG